MNEKYSLKIGLIENCCHSLKRGYQLWNQWQSQPQEDKDGWLLKEAIVWIHHGVELGLKLILFQTNEYLVFENVDKAVETLAKLREKDPTSGVLDLFEQGESAFSVGFKKLIDRVSIMLEEKKLLKDSDLRLYIERLAAYRNEIIHFKSQIDFHEVTWLMQSIADPFIELLQDYVQPSSESYSLFRERIREVQKESENILKYYSAFLTDFKKRVLEIVKCFNRQQVPQKLFTLNYKLNTSKEQENLLALPNFSKAVINDNPIIGIDVPKKSGVDMIIDSSEETWFVEIHLQTLWFLNDFLMGARIIDFDPIDVNKKNRKWFIFYSTIPNPESKLKKLNKYINEKLGKKRDEVFVSSFRDIQELGELLSS